MNTTWLAWLIVTLSFVVGYGITFMAILFFDWSKWVLVMGIIPSLVFVGLVFVKIEEEQNKMVLAEAAKLYLERNK